MKSRLQILALSLVASVSLSGCGDDDPTSPATDVYAAQLNAASEVHDVTSNATGTATFTRSGDTFTFTIDVTNIVGATAAHIHSGAAGANGPVVVPLFSSAMGTDIANGTLVSAAFSAADIVGTTGVTFEALVAMMASGGAYVNVHTQTQPMGEIRGQLSKQ